MCNLFHRRAKFAQFHTLEFATYVNISTCDLMYLLLLLVRLILPLRRWPKHSTRDCFVGSSIASIVHLTALLGKAVTSLESLTLLVLKSLR